MLISHEYKFIFIKTKKTAGSSLQAYLKPWCKNGVISEKLSNQHLTAQEIKKKVGDEIWENYTKIVPIRNPWDTTVSLFFWRSRKRPFYYYLYRWFIQLRWRPIGEKHLTFSEWVNSLDSKVNINREIIYSENPSEKYEFVRYEYLKEDLKAVCAELDIPFDPRQISNKKSGHRPKRDYKIFYNEKTREIVARAYDKEIKEFGYQF